MKRYRFTQQDYDKVAQFNDETEFDLYLKETGKKLEYKDINERYKHYDDPEKCLADGIEYCGRSIIPRAWQVFLVNELTQLGENMKCVDYGCGAGNVGIIMSEKGHQVDFIDVEGEITDFIKWRLNKKKIIGTVYTHKKYKSLKDDYYDLVFMINVLEHLKDPVAIIKTIYRILNVKGYFYYQWSTEEHGLDLLTKKDYQNKILPLIKSLFKQVDNDDERLWQKVQ